MSEEEYNFSELLSMKFSPVSCHFFRLRSKQYPQHPIPRHQQPVSFRKRPNKMSIQNNRYNFKYYICVVHACLNLYIFRY